MLKVSDKDQLTNMLEDFWYWSYINAVWGEFVISNFVQVCFDVLDSLLLALFIFNRFSQQAKYNFKVNNGQ